MNKSPLEDNHHEEIWKKEIITKLDRLENNQNEMMGLLRQLCNKEATSNSVPTVVVDVISATSALRGLKDEAQNHHLHQTATAQPPLKCEEDTFSGSVKEILSNSSLAAASAHPSPFNSKSIPVQLESRNQVSHEEEDESSTAAPAVSSITSQNAKPAFSLPLHRIMALEGDTTLQSPSPRKHQPHAPLTPGRLASPAMAQHSPRPQVTSGKVTPLKKERKDLDEASMSVTTPPSLHSYKREVLWTSSITNKITSPAQPSPAFRNKGQASPILNESVTAAPLSSRETPVGEKLKADVVKEEVLSGETVSDPHSVEVLTLILDLRPKPNPGPNAP